MQFLSIIPYVDSKYMQATGCDFQRKCCLHVVVHMSKIAYLCVQKQGHSHSCNLNINKSWSGFRVAEAKLNL